jgi:hypothetical protein
MPETTTPAAFDIFLSHGSPDKAWVRTLCDELVAVGLSVFLDEKDLQPGEHWAERLSDELAQSRALVLVLSAATPPERPWVKREWTAFLAAHEATSGRLIPVLLDTLNLPPLLNALQALKAHDRNAAQVARTIATRIDGQKALPPGVVIDPGQHLVFVLDRLDGDRLAITDAAGSRREVPAPWSVDNRFGVSWLLFDRLARQPIKSDADRAELHRHAAILGQVLFELLFDDAERLLLREATIPGRAPWSPSAATMCGCCRSPGS